MTLKNLDIGSLRTQAKESSTSLEKAKQAISVFETDSSEALVDDSINLCLQNFRELIQAGVADSKTVLLMTKVIDAYVKVESLKVKQATIQSEASEEQIAKILGKLKEIEGE